MSIRRSTAAIAVLSAALVLLVSVAVVGAGSPSNFVAPLNGGNERPSPVDTQARGVGIFQLSPDGSELSYRLIATNIENVTQAHIHCCGGSERGRWRLGLPLSERAPGAAHPRASHGNACDRHHHRGGHPGSRAPDRSR